MIVFEQIPLRAGTEVRFGYRTWTALNAKKHPGKWWWGQSAVIAPAKDFEELYQFAKENGLFG